MRYRTLGRTGLTVSEIGFGAWGIGGASEHAAAYGPTDDRESLRVLRRARDRGVTFYDTAELYGDGRSERLIGEAFKGCRSEVVIASKVGLRDGGLTHDLSPAHLRASLEGTLQRLRTDYLDLYQLHNPPIEWLERDEDIFHTLEALQRAGAIRAFSLSAQSPNDAVAMVQRWSLACLQVNFNLLDQRVITNGLMDLCRAQGVGLIARTPLCSGFLTGAYSPEAQFGSDDHRSQWSAEQRAVWAEAYRRFSSIKDREPQTPAQFALRYCVSYPAVSSAIPGMLTEQQLEENVMAGDLGPLTDANRLAVERVYAQHQFFLAQSRTAVTVK